MPGGENSKYTSGQKRKAEHISDSYDERGTSSEGERRGLAICGSTLHFCQEGRARRLVNASI
jgi:hypothetical protein